MAAFKLQAQHFTKQVFLRALATIYAFAFLSLYFQLPGLYGENGLLPAHIQLQRAKKENLWESFRNKVTLLWFAPYLGLSTVTCMEAICLLGTCISILAAIQSKCRNTCTFAAMWLLYFSVYQVGQTFLWFQWDILLLETGFISIFITDFNLGERKLNVTDGLSMWLIKWLLFRLMFASGVVKLTSRCPTWWGLTALNFHYESQCIPTPLAWYAHQLTDWFQRLSVALTFVIEIGLPFLFFAPVRWLRLFSFYAQVFFQVLIILTGNYNFFNLLTLVLCISLLDDRFLLRDEGHSENGDATNERPKFTKRCIFLLGKMLKSGTIMFSLVAVLYYTMVLFDLKIDEKGSLASRVAFSEAQFENFLRRYVPISIGIGVVSLIIEIVKAIIRSVTQSTILSRCVNFTQTSLFSCLAIWLFCISLVPHTDIERTTQNKIWPIIFKWRSRVEHFHCSNAYGLFRSMTGVGGRPEIVIEGSDSLEGPWKEYEFLYKPGKLNGSLPFCIPHQPRLDWQMWFASLGSYQHNHWFIHLINKLLEGEDDVLQLMSTNPFPERPPKFIKSTLYLYHYTRIPKNTQGILEGLQKSRTIKKWWWRNDPKEYTPPLEKNNPHVKKFLDHFGLLEKEEFTVSSKGSAHDFIIYLRTFHRRIDPTMALFGVTVIVLLAPLCRYFHLIS